ncbi:unnamed protein product [Rhizophagus irregularis]|uniref:BTB domain-containing protein n=1 Tax=Rhizophagus irregularis TaxID=588596 RepID=A0A2N1NHE6_9GLOM|nr:hypothetical protein RhiirC2_847742 [Rhizophagus irregularis]CAB4397394.1 unnamed protein product [Rhizophagus irregularis]
MTGEFWADVIDDYEKLFDTEEGYDTIFYVGENGNVVHAHSVILRIRSQYFRTAFSNKRVDKNNGMFIFSKRNIDLQVFKIILKFIYCGNVKLTDLQGPEILKIIIGSEEFNVQQLINYAKKFLNENKLKFLVSQPIEIFKIIHKNSSLFTKLWDDYLEIICVKPEIIFSSKKFPSIDESLLKDLLKCKAYKIEESKIWENVLKWGISKHPTFDQNINNLNKEQLKILKVTLNDIIPLIEFDYFDSTDVYQKVLPYKKLLSKEMINYLLKKFLDKSNSIRCCHRTRYHKVSPSIMLTPYHCAVFANWVDKESNSHYKIHNNPYKFKLLISKHVDKGMNLFPVFQSALSRAKATLIVARIKDSDKLVGGYNPNGFSRQKSNKFARDSFLFYFGDKDEVKSGRCGYVSQPENAIYYNERLEPAFGNGPDLLCKNDGNWTSKPTSYPSIGIPSNFEILHYEAFQVIKDCEISNV